jgi:hypothetical protein
MFLYVVMFQQMTFFAVKSSPSMMGLTVKNIIAKKELIFFKGTGVLCCTTFGLSQSGLAGLRGPLRISIS